MARRAKVLRAIREYFHDESVLEVVTPLLRAFGASEVHLENLSLEQGYLQTSPEYAMKQLLAESRQSIFQICPAFRGGEAGRKHRVEFQMLEWYRIDYSLDALMDDLEAMLIAVESAIGEEATSMQIPFPLERVTYKALFRECFGVCPHNSDALELRRLCDNLPVEHLSADARRTDLLDALFSQAIEPQMSGGVLVYDFPACQAALAEWRNDDEGIAVAHRFELFLGGMEIANAYQELTDGAELKRRFEENNTSRRTAGRPEIPDDPELPDAVEKMSRCAGAALGIDRLLMALSGETDIDLV